MAAAPPAAETVHGLLMDAGTRAATLSALEGTPPPIDPAQALAAAPALGTLLGVSADDVEHAAAQRIGLLLARLFVEASADQELVNSIFGAAFGEGRLKAYW